MQMQRFLSVLVTLAWGLWFGGLVTLFMAVTALFETFGTQRSIAGTGAASIFRRFELFQLALAATLLLATLAWRMLSGPSRLKVAILALLSVSTVCAMIETAVVARKIEQLRGQGDTQSAQFKKMHGTSMALYAGETVLLMAVGLLLPSTIARDADGHPLPSRGFEPDTRTGERTPNPITV
jgi:hypothetical protein